MAYGKMKAGNPHKSGASKNSSPGVTTDKGRPNASFKGAGANVHGSRGPAGGNYIAGKGKSSGKSSY
jgi:hypothetical protein